MPESFNTLNANFKSFLADLDQPLSIFNNTKITLASVVISIFIVILAMQLARHIGRLVNKGLQVRDVDSGVRDSLEKFVRYALIIVGLVFAMDNLGISMTSFTAVGAVLMVGIGFGLQNITQNFISGLILLIERPIKVGDIVNVGQTAGRVIDIRVRSTVIQTRDNVTIIVPNSKFVAEDVTNESYGGQRIRQHIKVSVEYGTDIDTVMQTMVLAAQQNPRVLREPPTVVLLKNFGESGLEFDLRFWSDDIWQIEPLTSEIRVVIAQMFKEQQIRFAYPQRDLHLSFAQSEKLKAQLQPQK